MTTVQAQPKAKPLTPKQARFVVEYLKDGNASQACVRAGYSAKNPDVDGPRLLVHAGIASAIEKRRPAMLAKVESDTIASLRELKERASIRARGTAASARIAEMERLASDPELTAGQRFTMLSRCEELRIARDDTAERATVTLFKVKGAFDTRRLPSDDKKAAVSRAVRSMIIAGWKPSQIEAELARRATDVDFTVESRNLGTTPGSTG